MWHKYEIDKYKEYFQTSEMDTLTELWLKYQESDSASILKNTAYQVSWDESTR